MRAICIEGLEMRMTMLITAMEAWLVWMNGHRRLWTYWVALITQCFCLGMPGPQASTNPALFLYTLHHSVATCVWLPVNSGSLGSCPSHINGLGRGYLVISYFPIEAIVIGYSHSSLPPKTASLSVSCICISCFFLTRTQSFILEMFHFHMFKVSSFGQWRTGKTACSGSYSECMFCNEVLTFVIKRGCDVRLPEVKSNNQSKRYCLEDKIHLGTRVFLWLIDRKAEANKQEFQLERIINSFIPRKDCAKMVFGHREGRPIVSTFHPDGFQL